MEIHLFHYCLFNSVRIIGLGIKGPNRSYSVKRQLANVTSGRGADQYAIIERLLD
jgi:hypothetical protein